MQVFSCRSLRLGAMLSAAVLLASCGGGGDGGNGGTGPTAQGGGAAEKESVASQATLNASDASEATATAAAASFDKKYERIKAQKMQQGSLAKWSPVINLPLVPVAGAQQADGRLLFWAANTATGFNGNGHTITAVFDPQSNAVVSRDVTETNHDMFCPATARLADGRLLVVGGYDNNRTSLYDPAINTWSKAPSTNITRGYAASTMLADGSIMVLGGSWNIGSGGRDAEVFTTQNGWRRLTGVPAAPFLLNGANKYEGWQSDAHMSLLPTANGQVLLAGPTAEMFWLDTRGNGSYTSAGRRGDDPPSLAGNVVMYDAGKILKLGGSTWNNNTPASANAYQIDTTSGNAQVKKLNPMRYPRIYSNSVVLPDGQVMVIGGQTTSQEFSDNYAVLAPELYDPETETFTVLPAMSVPRNYHSIAMLLADGRVVSGGGGLCNCAADHKDLQLLSPPYLFNADGSTATRPVIASAPTQLGYGTTVDVSTDSAVTSFALVRMGAVTHTVNNDQRRVALSFSAVDNTHYQVAIPSNAGILLPGQWMLFALNAQGTPSMAKVVTVGATGAPQLQNPGSINVPAGRSMSVAVTGSSSSGAISYSATGLPAGVTINAVTGVISGIPTTSGSYLITILASSGGQTVSTDVVMDVTAVGSGTGLSAQYFANNVLNGVPALQRTEAPYFNAGTTAAPGAGVPATNFSARWVGSIEATKTGGTQLRTNSDDGVRVWVNNQLVIDNWAPHGPTLNTASVQMVAGQRYPVMVEFYQNGGPWTFQLDWQPPGATAYAAVPVDRLYPATVPSTVNLAKGKTATQSSTYAGTYVASRAVDGNTNGVVTSGSVSHTNADNQAWWQVDLGSNSRIDLVQLWNRTDCCMERLSNFTVFVSASDMTGRTMAQLQADPAVLKRSVPGSGATITPNIGIPVNALGRYVRVQLAGTNNLQLAEVMVFGGPGEFRTPTIETIANQQGVVGTTTSIQASAKDPDGNALRYSATGLPPGMTLDAATGRISGTPTAAGSFSVTLSAANDGGKTASTSFAWVVKTAMPQVTALPVPAASSNGVVSYAPVISNSANARYSWNFGDGTGDTALAASTTANHSYASPGVYQVTLTIQTDDQRTTTYQFMQAVTAAGVAGGTAARASSGLLLEPRTNASERLWVVNPDANSVSVVDTVTNTRVAEVAVGQAPRSVARANDGRIWVVNRDAASISIINPGTLAVAQTVALPRASQPYGIVFSPTDGSAFVTLQALGEVRKLNGSTGAQLAVLSAGANVRHLSISGNGGQLLVSRFITRPLPGESTAKVKTADANGVPVGGEVLVVDPTTMSVLRTVVLMHSERVDSENQGRGIPNYLGAAAISPDGKTAWVPSKQDNVKRGMLRDGLGLNFESTVRAISSRIDLAAQAKTDDLTGRVDHDNASVASAALFHPSGAYMFVALETSRQVGVIDVAGKRELFRYEVGVAPQSLALSADGLKLYVHNTIGRTLSVVDLSPLIREGRITAPAIATVGNLATEKLSAQVLRGKQLFYDARDPRLARDNYMSCASCHNDGDSDGRVWDMTGFGEGLRRTIVLRGRAGMGQGYLHWSANFDEVQDFEGQIRALAGGFGLMSDADFNTGTRSQPLGLPKAGISADLDALAAYLTSLNTFAPSPWRSSTGTLTPAATAGRTVFLERNCQSCHGGTAFTLASNASGLKDIGTIKPSSGKRLDGPLPGINIPTLRDVWMDTAYLHDGSAATLADSILAHGKGSIPGAALSAVELSNLVEYMKQIGSEEVTAERFEISPLAGSPNAGTPFTDPAVSGRALTGVVVRYGWWIDAIQGLTAPASLPLHGGGGGNVTTIQWPAGEYLVRIYGKTGSSGVVAQISFVTNTGRVYGPYGTATEVGTVSSFDLRAPTGQRVLGFTGSSSAYLNAIGLLYGP